MKKKRNAKKEAGRSCEASSHRKGMTEKRRSPPRLRPRSNQSSELRAKAAKDAREQEKIMARKEARLRQEGLMNPRQMSQPQL